RTCRWRVGTVSRGGARGGSNDCSFRCFLLYHVATQPDHAMTIPGPPLAGTFYRASPDALDRVVRATLASANVDPAAAKAIVAPHAGYIYSGPIAGASFQSVAHLGQQINRVVLIGPTHRLYFPGIAVPTATGLATPLGTVPRPLPAPTLP